ncbi:MAG: class I SAM-dependent methyltransferase [Candidatus Kapaibacteriota bacterium]
MEIFDSEARHYDNWYLTPIGKFVDEVETQAILELLEPLPNMSILDAGCGTGNFSIKLAKLGCKVTGIDISNEMLKIAIGKAQKLNLNIYFIQGNAENLAFPNNFFDAVVSVATLEFIKQKDKAIEEFFRVVKHNGKIVIGFINRTSLWGELYLSDDFQKTTVFKYAHLFTKDEISKIHPLELVTIKETLYTPPTIKENEISQNSESYYSKINSGGFLVGLWKKK